MKEEILANAGSEEELGETADYCQSWDDIDEDQSVYAHFFGLSA